MKQLSKPLLVGAGYGAALLAAAVVVAIHAALTSGPDSQQSAGMSAFGDLVLFLAVFGVAAIPVTGAALYFLRPYPAFWRWATAIALAISTTGVAALVHYLAATTGTVNALPDAWSAVAALRLLFAPLLAMAYFLSGILSPSRTCRGTLLGAAVIEVIVFGWAAIGLLNPLR